MSRMFLSRLKIIKVCLNSNECMKMGIMSKSNEEFFVWNSFVVIMENLSIEIMKVLVIC